MRNKLTYSSNFNIKTSYFQKLYKFNEIFKSTNKINFNGEEWAYLYIFSNFKLVIPCKLILEKYYLSDKHIKNILYAARIQDLYSTYEFVPVSNVKPTLKNLSYDTSSNYILKINCKKNISKNTIQFLSRLLYDNRIHYIFNYLYIQKAICKSSFLKSYIPYFGNLSIKADVTVIDDIHIVTKFHSTLPEYIPYIFYTFEEPSATNLYKEIKLNRFKSYYDINKYNFIDYFHIEIIQYLLEYKIFKLINYKINQNIMDYYSESLYSLDYIYCIYFSYTLIEYKSERILIIYFSNEDYLNRNFLFRNFYYSESEQFIKSIICLIVNENFRYKKIKEFVQDEYNIEFYPLHIPKNSFLNRKNKALDVIKYIKDHLDCKFKKVIRCNLKNNYNLEKDDFINYCKSNPTFEEAIMEYGDKVFEYELLGKITIENGKILL